MLHLISKAQHVDDQQVSIRERVWSCCWHHNGEIMATAGEDRTIKIWKVVENLKENDKTVSLQLHCSIRGDQNRSIRCCSFSSCGRFLAAASFDATIIIYEYLSQTEEFEELHRLEGHESEVKCCAFSISGHYLATCSRDKSVWIWKTEDEEDENDYEVLSIIQQHTADVKFVQWHPREDILLSGEYDCSIRFYTFDGDDWTTAQAIPNAHDETVWSAAFEPSIGNLMATVGGDRIVRIWSRTNELFDSEENSTWRSWSATAELSLDQDTLWPLYTVAWSQPLTIQQKIVGIDDGVGILAVGGGDGIVRLFTFDAENKAIIKLASIRMGSEINCLAWRPLGSDNKAITKSENDQTPISIQSYQLAVALDDGHVHLLQMGE